MNLLDHKPPEATDVVILGGGVAGLTLALQLGRMRPETRITVLERSAYPLPETTHKVGESTVEVAAHYLRDVLGLGDHLVSSQLEKFGLRVFFSDDDNTDITRRRELGHATAPPKRVGTFQIDRGRLENTLIDRVRSLPNVTFHEQTRVIDVDLQPEQRHIITARTGSHTERIRSQWVIDATGRASLLKRQLGLQKKVQHQANAAWFRIAVPVDVDDWSDDPAWHARILERRRSLSTNHLMGRGYWVWIIPLASGSTSVGIVTDGSIHAFQEINNFDRALAWLKRHEPQCAAAVEKDRDKLQDFRVMRDYAYSVERVFSAQRWCLAGEAGVFLDPLYSPGLDLIAISNGLIADLISRGLDGEDIGELADIHNQMFLIISEGWLNIYTDQYTIMGNSRVMTAKIIWDTAAYWAVPGFLYFHDQIRRLVDHPEVVAALARFRVVSDAVQRFLREWAEVDQTNGGDGFLSLYDFGFMPPIHSGMTAGLDGDRFVAQFDANVSLIEFLSGQLVATVVAEYEPPGVGDAQTQRARAWCDDHVLESLVANYHRERDARDIDPGWITGHKLVKPTVPSRG